MVGEEGEFDWIFEETANQVDAPVALNHFQFCTEYADEYVLLQHETLGYANGNIYTMIRLNKNGSPVFSEMIPLPKMVYGCLFCDVMVNDKMLVLYGGVYDPDYQYVATAAAINQSAEVLWLKENTSSSSIGAAESLSDRYLFL